MKRLILATFFLFNSSAFGVDVYRIQFANNDELFIINDEVFTAKTYCLGWDRGDAVIFVEGDPNGVCVDAELYSLTREEKCEVWCGK